MKQKILYILLFVFSVLFGTGEAFAQTQYYVLDDNSENSVNNKTVTYTLSGPGAHLSYSMWNNATYDSYRKVDISASYKSSTESYTSISTNTTNTGTMSWDDFSMTLTAPYDGKIKFVGSKGDTMATKRIKNVKVTRASLLTPSSTSLSCSAPFGQTISQKIQINYSNTNSQGKIRCRNSGNGVSGFSSTEIDVTNKESGTTEVEVYFHSNTEGTYTGDIVLEHLSGSTSDYSVSIPYTFTVTGKAEPNITFFDQSYYPSHVYNLSDIFSSTNSDVVPIVSITNGDNVKISGDKLFVYSIGSFTIKVEQAENNIWEAGTATKTITVTDGTSETYKQKQNDFDISTGKTKTLSFFGPCDKVTYTAKLQTGAIEYGTEITTSQDHQGTWQALRTINPTTSKTQYEETITPTTTHIKFDRTGRATLNSYFRDVYFHMAAYMTPQQHTLPLGEWMQGTTSTTQSVLVDWSDVADYNKLTVTCDNPYFNVSIANNPCTPSNQTWGTSNTRWGQSTVSVSYSPQAVGTHTATVYVRDDKRFTTFTVSGTAYSNHLQLQPTVDLSTQHTGQEYPYVTLNRTLNSGYSTLTLPFDTNVSELSGYTGGDFVAQLSLVTYNEADGYTLFFKQVADGTISAHQPYVISRTNAVTNPQWTNRHVNAPEAATVSGGNLKNWSMTGNYTPAFTMSGKYGLAGGELRKGTSGSTLNAYTAYFTPPASAQNVRTRVAIMDEWGNTTYIGEVRGDQILPEYIYSPNGTRRTSLQPGINIVRSADGTARKVLK